MTLPITLASAERTLLTALGARALATPPLVATFALRMRQAAVLGGRRWCQARRYFLTAERFDAPTGADVDEEKSE